MTDSYLSSNLFQAGLVPVDTGIKTSRDFEMLIRRLADSMTEKIKGQQKPASNGG